MGNKTIYKQPKKLPSYLWVDSKGKRLSFFGKIYKRLHLYSSFKTNSKYEHILDFFIQNDIEKALYDILHYVFKNSNNQGDYLEFGVWEGKSFIRAYNKIKAIKNKNTRLYAFDSFEGLPEPLEEEKKQMVKGSYCCSKDRFVHNLKKAKVNLGDVEVIEGFYENTLNKELQKRLKIKNAGVIYIDCDLYQSTVKVLDFIVPYINTGTVIIFDDWYLYEGRDDQGQRKAFNDWIIRTPNVTYEEFIKVPGHLNSFLMNKENKNEKYRGKKNGIL